MKPFVVNVADLVNKPGARRRERVEGRLPGPVIVVDSTLRTRALWGGTDRLPLTITEPTATSLNHAGRPGVTGVEHGPLRKRGQCVAQVFPLEQIR